MGFIRPRPESTFALPPGRRFPLDSLQERLHILVGVGRRVVQTPETRRLVGSGDGAGCSPGGWSWCCQGCRDNGGAGWQLDQPRRGCCGRRTRRNCARKHRCQWHREYGPLGRSNSGQSVLSTGFEWRLQFPPNPYPPTCWMVQRLTSRSLASSRWLTPFDRSTRMYSRCRSLRLGRRPGKRPSARAFAWPATERSLIEFRHHSLKASTI